MFIWEDWAHDRLHCNSGEAAPSANPKHPPPSLALALLLVC